MTFWVVTAVVLVVLFVIAWVTSGRSGPGVPDRHDARQDQARAQAEMHRTHNINGPPGPPRF